MKRYLIPFLTAVLFATVAAGCPGPTPPPPPPQEISGLIAGRTDTIPDGTFLTSGQQGVKLLEFSVTNTSTDARIASMHVEGGAAGNAVSLGNVTRLKLYGNDGTLVSSIVPFSASSTSFDVNYVIPAGNEKGFFLAADFGDTATGTFQIALTHIKALDQNQNFYRVLNRANMQPLSPVNPINSAQFRITP